MPDDLPLIVPEWDDVPVDETAEPDDADTDHTDEAEAPDTEDDR